MSPDRIETLADNYDDELAESRNRRINAYLAGDCFHWTPRPGNGLANSEPASPHVSQNVIAHYELDNDRCMWWSTLAAAATDDNPETASIRPLLKSTPVFDEILQDTYEEVRGRDFGLMFTPADEENFVTFSSELGVWYWVRASLVVTKQIFGRYGSDYITPEGAFEFLCGEYVTGTMMTQVNGWPGFYAGVSGPRILCPPAPGLEKRYSEPRSFVFPDATAENSTADRCHRLWNQIEIAAGHGDEIATILHDRIAPDLPSWKAMGDAAKRGHAEDAKRSLRRALTYAPLDQGVGGPWAVSEDGSVTDLYEGQQGLSMTLGINADGTLTHSMSQPKRRPVPTGDVVAGNHVAKIMEHWPGVADVATISDIAAIVYDVYDADLLSDPRLDWWEHRNTSAQDDEFVDAELAWRWFRSTWEVARRVATDYQLPGISRELVDELRASKLANGLTQKKGMVRTPVGKVRTREGRDAVIAVIRREAEEGDPLALAVARLL